MDFTKYEEMSRIDYHLEFEGMGGSDGYFTFAEEDGATTVTWAFISKMPFFYRFMNYMMDGMLGPDLEKGLNNLKELVENSSDEELGITPPQTPITMGSIHGTSYAMIRETLSIKNDMDGFFAPAYGRLHGYITENSQTIMGPACALYYTWDTLNDQTDVAAAFPLSEPVSEEGKEIQIAAGKAMLYSNHITYKMVGAYNMENFGAAHEALGAYLEENGKTATSPVVEEYVKGPNDQIPPEEYVTNITYYFE
jgi:effector-binding domain-containing protein